MTNNSIDKMRGALTGNGARPNMFKVTLAFPAGVGAGIDAEKASILVKAAALPASVMSVIEVPYRGRKLKIAGDRSFEPWTITVINDTDFKIRNAFEKWMSAMSRAEDNIAELASLGGYATNMSVEQMDRNNVDKVLKKYEFRGVFPTNVSTIDLNYDTVDTIEEFTVELQYQYWVDVQNNIQ